MPALFLIMATLLLCGGVFQHGFHHAVSLVWLSAGCVLFGATVNLLCWIAAWRDEKAVWKSFIHALHGMENHDLGDHRVVGTAILLISAILMVILVVAGDEMTAPAVSAAGVLGVASAVSAVLEAWSNASVIGLAQAMRQDAADQRASERSDA